jgi:hypothetical protein
MVHGTGVGLAVTEPGDFGQSASPCECNRFG